jgi:hypothetical protein
MPGRADRGGGARGGGGHPSRKLRVTHLCAQTGTKAFLTASDVKRITGSSGRGKTLAFP